MTDEKNGKPVTAPQLDKDQQYMIDLLQSVMTEVVRGNCATFGMAMTTKDMRQIKHMHISSDVDHLSPVFHSQLQRMANRLGGGIDIAEERRQAQVQAAMAKAEAAQESASNQNERKPATTEPSPPEG